MAPLPKLSVKKEATDEHSEIQDFEEARNFPFDQEIIIVAEGRQVTSYEDLLKLAAQEKYKDRKFLEVMFLPMIVGG
jgi:hypothetical protein